MTITETITRSLLCAACAAAAAAAASGCGRDARGESLHAGGGISPQRAADMLHTVIEADRATYTRHVVNRLTQEQQVRVLDPVTSLDAPLAASEQWKSEPGTLPLPAQMLRMGAEQVARAEVGVTYVLLSPWPINDQNAARTDLEERALERVVATAEPFYGEETLGGRRYFTAAYPDRAVAGACVACHNEHPSSPRRDFEVGDVMGALVIRLPL